MAFFRRNRERTVQTRAAAAEPTRTLGAPRALATLLGAAVAGLLIWLATQVGTGTTGEYWATYGLVAAAGLTMALSQLVGGWTKWGGVRLSPLVFLLAFVPVLVVGGWILLAQQPHPSTWSTHVTSWSRDISVLGLVHDLGNMLAPIAFGIGLVLGFVLDTTGPRVGYAQRDVERTHVARVPVERRAADEPVTAERAVAANDDRELARRGTPVAPQPEPEPRTVPPDDTA
jgi:hypothetical protein